MLNTTVRGLHQSKNTAQRSANFHSRQQVQTSHHTDTNIYFIYLFIYLNNI